MELELDFTECGIRKAPILKSKMLRTLVASLYFFLRRGQSVEVWLMTRTGQAGPCVHIRIQASNRHGSDHATGTIELALIRKAGTQENLEVDRLVPKLMAADPTQRVGDNAFHLPVFLAS